MSDWTIIFRSISGRSFSAITTILTVAVAVALLMTILMLRSASREAFQRGGGDMHILISRDASPLVSVLNGVFYAGAPRNPILYSDFQALSTRFPLEYAIPLQLGDSYEGVHPVVATTTDFFTKFKPDGRSTFALRDGRLFEREFELVLGSQVASFTGLRIGDPVVLTHGMGKRRNEPAGHVHDEFRYTVVGIAKPTGTPHDRALFSDLTSTWITHAFDKREREEHAGTPANADAHSPGEHPLTAADLTDQDRLITNIYLRVAGRPGTDASSAVPAVFDALRRDTSITVANPSQEVAKLFVIVSNIDQVFVGLAAAVLISSGIAIMLALANSMALRRRQIAVLRVLGASRPRVFGLVMTESALLGLGGAIVGVLMGIVGAMLVAGVLKHRTGVSITPVLTPELVLGLTLGTIALAMAAGLTPAIMAYRTSVAKNLRPLG